MSNETTNQESVTNDMDNFKEYLKTSFEVGSAYTETFIISSNSVSVAIFYS